MIDFLAHEKVISRENKTKAFFMHNCIHIHDANFEGEGTKQSNKTK